MHPSELTRLHTAASEDRAAQARSCGELRSLHPAKGKNAITYFLGDAQALIRWGPETDETLF